MSCVRKFAGSTIICKTCIRSARFGLILTWMTRRLSRTSIWSLFGDLVYCPTHAGTGVHVVDRIHADFSADARRAWRPLLERTQFAAGDRREYQGKVRIESADLRAVLASAARSYAGRPRAEYEIA